MIRKIALQIGIPALLVFIAFNAYLAVNHLRQVQNLAAATLQSAELRADLANILKDVTDMETGQRGFLLTGNSAYLQPYTEAKARIETDFAGLRASLTSRAQSEKSQETQLESLARSKQDEMDRSIRLREQGYRRRSFNLVDSNEGKSYMDEIRQITSALISAETSSFARLDGERIAELKRVLSVTIVANAILLVFAMGLFVLVRRHGRVLGEEASKSRNELAMRDLELAKLTSALSGQARSNIIAINMNSQLLLEKYGDFLPRQGHEYAELMQEAASQMEQLRLDLVGSRETESEGRAA
jgi:CHASE3 domain sensor protein